MAQPEESFKVCGLCSQLVDEAVKLTDILLDFLTKFLNVDGSNLPSKICTECFQGAIDSKKFKEKCLRTVEKLKKTHISSTMILGRSTVDVKHMKNKFKNGLDLVEPEFEDCIAATKPNKIKHAGENIIAAPFSGRRSAAKIDSRKSSINSINEDTPLAWRQRRTNVQRSSSLTSLTEQYGAHLQPRVRVPEAERRLAEDMLLEGSLVERSRYGRVMKRKVASPEDPVPLDMLKSKKVKTEPGPDTFPYRPGNKVGKPKSKAPKGYKGYAYVEESDMKDSDLYDADENEEEIFPSLGPYQCEICQEITDTKQEFVAHIKALHKDMVDEAVLRSLESDLKKRKKKEMAASPEGKKPPRPVKSPVPPVGAPPKIDKLKPRPRPIKRYTEVESDDEYKPSNRGKKILKKKSSLKTEVDPAVIKAKLEPGNCKICGTHLSRATDIPKHQESLKCRQAAFNLAQERHKKAKEDEKLEDNSSGAVVGDDVANIAGEQGDKKLSVIQEKVSEIDKNDVDAIANKVLEETFGSSPNKVIDTFDSGTNKVIGDASGHNSNKVVNSFGNNSMKEFNGTRVPSDSDDVAHNVPNDAKFKNSIAKRYEAERNDSSDSKETDNVTDVKKGMKPTNKSDEYEIEDFDEEAAIKAAMQESIETAQKELGQPSKTTMPLNKTNSPSVVGDHSPAAYIDPAPQPDVVPFRDPSKSSVIVTNMNKHQQHGITGKEWVDNCREPTTVDLEALGEPTSLPPQPNLPVHMDIESQMAALHGATGANTPWQEFNEKYFGH